MADDTVGTNSPDNSGQQPTTDQVAQAADNAIKAQNLNPDTMTPNDLVELINALPDKIVNAIREATVTKPAGNPPATESESQGKFFGYRNFAEWWTGNKTLE